MYPILFELGPLAISSLWLILSIGFMVGLIFFLKSAQYQRLPLEFIFQSQIKLLIISLLGSRLTFIIFNLDIYFPIEKWSDYLRFLIIWDHGLSFWGGLFSFVLFFQFLLRQAPTDLKKKWFDCLTIPLFIILIFGNIGDFFDGKNYGTETKLPWGITFDSVNVKYTVPIHPVQIYAAIYILAIILFIKYYIKKREFFKGDGLTALTGLTLYTLLRFFHEFFLGDDTIELWRLRLAQIICLVLFLVSLFLWQRQYKIYQPEKITTASRPSANNPPPSEEPNLPEDLKPPPLSPG